jgi:cell division septation protein DedD
MYDFSLDKKTLVFIIVCCLVVGGLLFFAGTIVGLDRGSHETQARMEKEFSARLAAANASAPPEAAQAQPDDSGMAMSESPDPDPDPAPAERSSDSPSRPQLFPVAATMRSPANTSEENSAEAEDAVAEDEADADSESANDYSLQIGAFRSQDNAARLRDDLKARGYAVYLLRTVDERGNEWHTVRLGHYHDRAEASNEAASFSGETQLAAVVRAANQ